MKSISEGQALETFTQFMNFFQSLLKPAEAKVLFQYAESECQQTNNKQTRLYDCLHPESVAVAVIALISEHLFGILIQSAECRSVIEGSNRLHRHKLIPVFGMFASFLGTEFVRWHTGIICEPFALFCYFESFG